MEKEDRLGYSIYLAFGAMILLYIWQYERLIPLYTIEMCSLRLTQIWDDSSLEKGKRQTS